MPIYEFYCPACHVVFNFLVRGRRPQRGPACPRCRRPNLEKQLSRFSATGRAKAPAADGAPALADTRMDRVMDTLAAEAEQLNEEDPRQAARFMRHMSDATGLKLGTGLEEALGRLEAGEDPETIESELGDRLGADEPLFDGDTQGGAARARRPPPRHDDTLYEW